MFALIYFGEESSTDAVSHDVDKLKQHAEKLSNQSIEWNEWCGTGFIGYVGNLDKDGESETGYTIEKVTEL